VAKGIDDLAGAVEVDLQTVERWADKSDERVDDLEEVIHQLGRAINILHDRFEAHIAPKPSLWSRAKTRVSNWYYRVS
jgi:uncharacterized Ntn-hydrolase superfamily protein